MKIISNSSPRVADIMTPRSLFICLDEQESHTAAKVAYEMNFDVVPLLCRGEIRKYWSRAANRHLPITKRHRVSHDTAIEDVLPRLNDHLVQFVHYRSQIVGLVDISDLNKPLARLAWLRAILECEQSLLGRVLVAKLSVADVVEALGPAARNTEKRWRAAHRENLDLPLLSFAHFIDVLKATEKLGFVSLSVDDMKRLNNLRNRLAHGTRELIEKISDGQELVWAQNTCRRILSTTI